MNEVSQYEPGGSISHRMLEVTKAAANPVFFSIIYPRKADFERPQMVALAVSGNGGVGGTITWNDQLVDTIVSGRGEVVSTASLTTDARMSAVRTLDDRVETYAIGEGTQLAFGGESLVEVERGTGSVSMSGKELALSGNISAGRFYGPDVETLRVDELEAPFTRDGAFIRFVREGEEKP